MYAACIYVNADDDIKCKNFVLLTLKSDHSYNVSSTLDVFLIKKLQKVYPIATINFWSDGCSSQFRSKYFFYRMAKYDHNMKIEWYYFDVKHGKGPYICRKLRVMMNAESMQFMCMGP